MSVDTRDRSANDTDGTETSESAPGRRLGRYVVEAILGFAIAMSVALAILASTGEIPFVYQGY